MSVKQYLQHYAEGKTGITDKLKKQWQNIICIPAFDEADTLPALIRRLSEEKQLLVVLVLNCPQSAKNTEAFQRTQKLAEIIKQQFSLQQTVNDTSKLFQLNQKDSHLLLLEQYSIPDKEGVGLARKIACDIACSLIHEKKVESSWIFSTDADVSLPAKYFSASKQLDDDTAAAIFTFKHKDNSQDKTQASLQLYEYSLYYYVEALKWAGSPYAFHTIGSTLLLHHQAYALARGFPKRAAGEDFYLLNKLAKIGKIKTLTAPVLTLSGRPSSRVPFGTGPAIKKISTLNYPDDEYLFYHPECFLHLKNWLALIPSLWQMQDLKTLVNNELLFKSLCEVGIEIALSHALENSNGQATFIKHMHNWFDAFRTLRLIHSLRDMSLNSINHAHLQDFRKDFPFINNAKESQGINK